MSRIWFAALFAVGLVGLTFAQDAPKASDPDRKAPTEKPKSPTIKVEKSALKSEVPLKGSLEASDVAEVLVKPEVWSSFVVLKAVEPGTAVKAGDVLVEFDPEKIDRAIRDMEADQRLADLTLRGAEMDLPLAERATPLDLASAERAFKQAKEDFEKWINIDKKLSIESTEMSLKSAQSNLDNQKEELKQLEKMYRTKDLTEETEEIILKRQRFQVEQAEHFFKLSKNRRDHALNVELARREKDLRDGLERAEIAYKKAMSAIPMGLEQKKLAVEKAKYERGRAKEKFENLRKDRQLFTVKAPADGVVYWGKCVLGAWSSTPTKLLKGGTVTGDDAFMTIIKPGGLFVRAQAEEKDVKSLAVGQPVRMSTPAFPDAKFAGVVEKVGTVPVGGGYEVRVKVGPTQLPIIPGMSAGMRVLAYEKKDALTLPNAVIQTDEDDDRHYVWKSSADKAEKVYVKLGKRSGSKVEILEGLSLGDEVRPKKPGAEG